jgi:hypothetical protein
MYIVVGECGEHFNVLQVKHSSTGTGFSWLAKSLLTVLSWCSSCSIFLFLGDFLKKNLVSSLTCTETRTDRTLFLCRLYFYNWF